MINTPQLKYPDRQNSIERPSWSSSEVYINDEHRDIFENTKDIPGWQLSGDTYKLYEMGFFAGDTILEIGTYGGRSAIVEIKGALANKQRKDNLQYFGIDLDPAAIERTYSSLRKEKLHKKALLFHGDLKRFSKKISITPTMVFLDGDHKYESVKSDLRMLSQMLPAGVPVLCHDYLNPGTYPGEYGVKEAVDEWQQEGLAEFYNCFGCSALMVTTAKCKGKLRSAWSSEKFRKKRKKLIKTFFSSQKKAASSTKKSKDGKHVTGSTPKTDSLASGSRGLLNRPGEKSEHSRECSLPRGGAFTVYHIFPDLDKGRIRESCADISDPFFWEVYEKCKAYSLLSIERFYNIFRSVEYISKCNIPGDFVECGVFLGGSVMAALLFARHFGIVDRKFYVYDTFEGFPENTVDIHCTGGEMKMSGFPDFRVLVEENISSVGIDLESCVFVQGPVESTLEETTPETICLLRLDTDYYESTRIELQVLYPLLVSGGVLIVDDYGVYVGVRKATDEYLAEIGDGILLHRLDITGRSGVKPARKPGAAGV